MAIYPVLIVGDDGNSPLTLILSPKGRGNFNFNFLSMDLPDLTDTILSNPLYPFNPLTAASIPLTLILSPEWRGNTSFYQRIDRIQRMRSLTIRSIRLIR
jgi:hypothetical protein